MDLVKQGNDVVYDNLISGHEIPLMPIGIELLSNQGILKKGSILMKDTSGKYKLIATGTDEPVGILTDDIDTNTETVCAMYRQGVFNPTKLIVGEGVASVDILIDALRKINILTRTII